MADTHPGTITFEDHTGGAAAPPTVRPWTEVPRSVAFAEVEGVTIPVVRVVRNGGEITAYGADGRALQRTYQRRP